MITTRAKPHAAGNKSPSYRYRWTFDLNSLTENNATKSSDTSSAGAHSYHSVVELAQGADVGIDTTPPTVHGSGRGALGCPAAWPDADGSSLSPSSSR